MTLHLGLSCPPLVLLALLALSCKEDPVAVDNPVPAVTVLAPATVTQGDPLFVLAVTGNDFVQSSVVRWNGRPDRW